MQVRNDPLGGYIGHCSISVPPQLAHVDRVIDPNSISTAQLCPTFCDPKPLPFFVAHRPSPALHLTSRQALEQSLTYAQLSSFADAVLRREEAHSDRGALRGGGKGGIDRCEESRPVDTERRRF